MPRPRIIQPQADLFASKDRSPAPNVPEQENLLALVSLLLTETTVKAVANAAEDGHEDHV